MSKDSHMGDHSSGLGAPYISFQHDGDYSTPTEQLFRRITHPRIYCVEGRGIRHCHDPVGTRSLPLLMSHIAKLCSRELFLLAITSIGLGFG